MKIKKIAEKMVGKDGSEKGFALVLTLIFMLTMTLIGLSVILNMNSDMFIARNDRDAKLAFQLAEGGLQEAMARMHLASSNANYIGEKVADANYRTTTWNDNNSLGNNFGCTDATLCPDGYNAADRGTADDLGYEVSINYLTETNLEGYCDINDIDNPAGTLPPGTCDIDPPEVVMFGQDFNIASTVTFLEVGAFPVYIIRSTGTSAGGAMKIIEAYVGASSLNLDSEYPLNSNSCITVSGNSTTMTDDVTGLSTPVMQLAGCACDPKIDPVPGCLTKASTDPMSDYLGMTVPEIKDIADERHYCLAANCSGANDDIPASGQIGGVIQDWGDWAGDSYAQYLYFENNSEISITSNYSGRGLLIVTGDLRISGSLNWDGLIYVMGTLTIAGGGGGLNVNGGVMGNNVVDIAGNIDVNYNKQVLLDISRENASTALLLWRRL